MAQPQAYDRDVDFTERDGDDTNHAAINAELDAAALSINEIRTNLALIQKDDGTLANGSVGAEQLNSSAFTAVLGAVQEATQDAQDAATSATIAASTAIGARDAATAARDSALTASNAAQLNASLAAASASTASTAATAAIRDIYYGPLAADPTQDPNGNPVGVGDLYYNTVSGNTRVFTGTSWIDVAQGTSTPFQSFSGTGVQTAFTLSGAPGTLGSVEVFISGVRQVPTTNYTISGTTLTFVTAPPAGTNNIFVRWITTQPINVPADASVSSIKLQDGSVTGPKLADGSVTPAKVTAGTYGINISGSAASATTAGSATTATTVSDNAITTNKVADNAVTLAKLQDIATARILGRATAGTGDVEELSAVPSGVSVPAAGLTGNVAAARITNALNASGSAPIYACRAWVNFNGTGTVAIRASGNVSSITDNGVGDYTVNFTTAMPDANYSGPVGAQSTTNLSSYSSTVTTRATGSFKVLTRVPTASTNAAPTAADFDEISVAIFR